MSPSAEALLEFNDGRDKLNVNAGYGISYDSNLFAHAGGAGDFSQSLSLGINYLRRAGLIGVSGSIGVSTDRFDKYTGEDFTDPTFQLEFSKDRGRLTGAINLRLNARANGVSPTMVATREFVVPRSIPTTRPIKFNSAMLSQAPKTSFTSRTKLLR